VIYLGGALKASGRARKGMMKELLEDLDPRVRKYVKRLINNYHGEELDEKLKELMDLKKTMKLIELRG
jgi:DNA-directed RNA polymerase specialized sigma24 family protein